MGLAERLAARASAREATAQVDCGALVAWRGERVRVSGVCGRLRLRDVVLPRLPQALRLRLEGPCRVWVQGTRLEPRPPRRRTGP